MKFNFEVGQEKKLHVAKTSTIRNWELSTCSNIRDLKTEDFFVERSSNKIYSK